MNNKFNFTIPKIKSLPCPEKGNKAYYDSSEKGLCLIASYGGSKTFYLYKKVNGRPERIKLGRFPDIKIERARSLAMKAKNAISEGINPNKEKYKLRQSITFEELFDVYQRYLKPRA